MRLGTADKFLKGGQARKMNCSTPLMNSWHSFSPNGRWMVFSSKSRSPFTQMYLTHLDDKGNDSPPGVGPCCEAEQPRARNSH